MINKNYMFAKNDPPVQSEKPKLEPYEIHVMPTKFQKYSSPKKGGNRFVLIALIIVILAIVAFGAYYFFNFLQQQSGQATIKFPTINQNNNVNSANLNVNLNQGNLTLPLGNLNANLNANSNLNTNVTNLNVNLNSNTNAVNSNTNVNAPTTSAINYYSSLDSDKDGLTDVEEDLYGTQVNKPDTDEDGFTDGSELINLYNPLAAGGSLLVTSGLVNTYTNPSFNYQIYYPAKWLARPTDQSLQEVIFQSTTDEYISVKIENNPQKLALVDWFNGQFPDSDLNQLQKNTTKNGMQVLTSADKLTNYLYSDKTPDVIYVISYFIDSRTSVNFLTTFSMMLNSFSIVPKL
jgi:flagellar basal body-associated protein FliL